MRLVNADMILGILVDEAQNSKKFKWGRIVRFTPSQVADIINKRIQTVEAIPAESVVNAMNNACAAAFSDGVENAGYFAETYLMPALNRELDKLSEIEAEEL